MVDLIDRGRLRKELAPYEENDFSQQMDVILQIVNEQDAYKAETYGKYLWCHTEKEAAAISERLPSAFLSELAQTLIDGGYLQVIKKHYAPGDPLMIGPNGETLTVGVKLTVAKWEG